MSNFLILMSGGTTPVINSTLSGILKVLKNKKVKVFSGKPGISGVLENNFLDISNFNLNKIKSIGLVPGSHYIGTTRVKILYSIEIDKFKNILKKKILPI